MSRLIDADKLKKDVLDLPDCYNGFSDTYDKACIIGVIDEQPTIKPRKGMWIERTVSRAKAIEEWQSARCSVCGLYHTTPYLYYFNHYNYCPNCGARLEKNEM